MNLYADSAAKFGKLLSKPDKISSSDENPDKFGYKLMITAGNGPEIDFC